MSTAERPLELNELDSPRRPNLRSPFADVFNNFWASFSTPSANPNDTLSTNTPSIRHSKSSRQPTPFVSTPFQQPVAMEASTVSVQRSIASSLQEIKISSKSFMTDFYAAILVFSSYFARHFVAIPLVCFVGTMRQIKYSQDAWGRLCTFALERNNTALYKYRQHVKRLFLFSTFLSAIFVNIAYTHHLSLQVSSTVVNLKNHVQEYVQASHMTILDLVQQQLKISNKNEPIKEAKEGPKELGPNIAHLFRISSISEPAIVYPDNLLGKMGLIWSYKSYPPPIMLEDGMAVVGKNYCTNEKSMEIVIKKQSSEYANYVSIRWPLKVNKPTDYTLDNVVFHFSTKSRFEEMDVFQILPRDEIKIRLNYIEDGINCAYKIGLHADYK